MKNMLIIGLILCGGVRLCTQPTPANAEVVDKIVALLDDELILLSEVRECRENPVVRVIANLKDAGAAEQTALPYMIERRLLLREIRYLASPKDIEHVRMLATQYIIATYYQNDAQAFTQNVQAQGISEAALSEELLIYMKGLDYIRRKYRFNADIDAPDTVLNLFRQWVEELRAKAKIQTFW